MYSVYTGALKFAPTHVHGPADRSNTRITKGAWFPRGCILLSAKRGSGREGAGEGVGEGNGGGGEKKGRKRWAEKEKEIDLSTQSINRAEKIRGHDNGTKIALITIIIIMRATHRVNIVAGRD